MFSSTASLMAKFVISRCVFANFEWVFCSINHLSGGGVNAHHNATQLTQLSRKNKIENDP